MRVTPVVHFAARNAQRFDSEKSSVKRARDASDVAANDAAREVRAIARAGILAAARRIADPAWRERFLHDVPAHRALLTST